MSICCSRTVATQARFCQEQSLRLDRIGAVRVERKLQNGPEVTSSVLTRLVFISALLGFIAGFGALVLLMPPAVQGSDITQLPSDAERDAAVFMPLVVAVVTAHQPWPARLHCIWGAGKALSRPMACFGRQIFQCHKISGSAVGILRISKLQFAADYPP